MILSHRHKFVFIKGEKVAGTSAEIALSQICGPDDIVTPISRRDEEKRSEGPRNYQGPFFFFRRRPRFYNHMPLRDVLGYVPSASDYEILCVERSPYAKVMSLANWVQHHMAYSGGGDLPRHFDLIGAVDQIIRDGQLRRVFNLDRYRDQQGRITARPWRSETLADDMAEFFKSRGLEPIAPPVTKRGAGSDALNVAEVLRRDQINLINEVFAEEFDLLGWPRV